MAPLPRGDGPVDLHFRCVLGAPDADLADRSRLLYTSSHEVEVVYLYELDDGFVLRFADIAEFHLKPHRIECYLHDEFYEYGVEIWLLGQVLAFWLEWQQIPALHASGVVVDGSVAAFLATNRGGKTSLAAALMQRGCALLTDDILAMDPSGRVTAHPAYPELRMWPDLAEHFTGRAGGHRTVHPYIEKLRVPAAAVARNAFLESSRPLGVVYVPERVSGLEAVEIIPLAPDERLKLLLRHSFTSTLIEAAGLHVQRLHVLGRLATIVPFRHLRYPDGLDLLPDVARAIQNDMKRLPEASEDGSTDSTEEPRHSSGNRPRAGRDAPRYDAPS